MSAHPQTEKRPAQSERVQQRSAWNILDDIRGSYCDEAGPTRLDQSRVVLRNAFPHARSCAIRLAWRARVDHVELPPVLRQILQRIRLVELERVMLLRLDVHPD